VKRHAIELVLALPRRLRIARLKWSAIRGSTSATSIFGGSTIHREIHYETGISDRVATGVLEAILNGVMAAGGIRRLSDEWIVDNHISRRWPRVRFSSGGDRMRRCVKGREIPCAVAILVG